MHIDKHSRCTPPRTTGCTTEEPTLSSMTRLLSTLEAEWNRISATPAARRAARRWAATEPLLDAANPADLVTRLHSAKSHHSAQDAVNALARIAAQGDPLAAQTALQIVLPLVARRTTRALAAVGYANQLQADAHAEAVAAALDRIHRLPSQPTPTPLWSIERAVRSRLNLWLRQHRNRVDEPTDPNEIPEPAPSHLDTDPNPGEQLIKILEEAVSTGTIMIIDASLIAITRISGTSFEDLARNGSWTPATYSRRRRQAESALAAAHLKAAS